ncbi:MAG TPA: proline dehydrogenase family protein [Nitrososphaerales archaeon]|nr:proline dehydrogenase family protein [Nitrososphaerales archaeon]
MPGLLLRLARQWVAGESASSGIDRAKKANARGILALLNLLGEHLASREEIKEVVSEYEHLLELISESKVNSQVSVKPTQLGLNLDFDFCVSNYLQIARSCEQHEKNWLWIDMENSPYTQKTLDLYKIVLESYPNTGVAIQAYLRRSEGDLRKIVEIGGKVRLVKGAYNEPPEISIKGKDKVRKNYARLMEILFSLGDKKKGNFFAVATHDRKLVDLSKELAKSYGASSGNNDGGSIFEYEMLMGVRDNLKSELATEGFQVREYIPYGPQWLPYSIRRIREKKSNIFLLARSLFSG